MYRISSLSVVIAVVVLLAGTALAGPPKHEGKVVLFGNLHAHSKLSDDISGATNALLPTKAFKYADDHGLDFIAITDHHKAANSNHRLFMTQNEYKTQLFDVATQYNKKRKGKFIAIPGIEWGNTATGNHLNIFGASALPPDSIRDADYDELFEWAKTHAKFIQFNHPDGWSGKSNRNKAVGNFGSELYGPTKDYVEEVDPVAKTISVITSVFGGHLTGKHAESDKKTHRDLKRSNYNQYKKHLNMGFHLSPAANQDTHRANWGTVTAARTAAWADSFAFNDLMKAFRANRVYATEDDEMVIVYQARYKGKTYWMGDTVPLADEEEDVELRVRIWQARGSDSDDTDEGPYTVHIISDWDGPGGRRAAVWDTVEDIPSKQTKTIPVSVLSGEYIYLEVVEQNGKDNLIGDGDDVFDNSTGDFGGDGLRDDPNNSAWTSPIWFTFAGASEQAFIWSKNSNLYHDPDCWVVKMIGDANKRNGAAPEGKTKHDCHP